MKAAVRSESVRNGEIRQIEHSPMERAKATKPFNAALPKVCGQDAVRPSALFAPSDSLALERRRDGGRGVGDRGAGVAR